MSKVLPEVKKPNVLEEAEWEDDGGGFEKEKMMQGETILNVWIIDIYTNEKNS